MSVICIIPARIGSKRIKKKNIRILNNIKLINYTIDYAKKQKIIDHIHVSTDSEEIKRVVKKRGIDVPFLRPKEFATDSSNDSCLIIDAFQKTEDFLNKNFDIIVFLRPVIPFRDKNILNKCVRTLQKNACDSVRTVKSVEHTHPYWMTKKNNKGKLNFLYKDKNIFNYYQSQMLPKFYKHDGCCDCFATSKLRKINPKSSTLKDIYGNKMYGVENNYKFHINIDTLDDWKLAEIYSKQIK